MDVPDPFMLDEEILHDKLVELEVTARLTVALKPLREVTVIVEFLEEPVVVEILVGLADIWKLGTGTT